MSSIKRLIEKEIDNLPALPTTVMKVLEICKDANLKPADLNRVISLDPVLTGTVLKLINSAYYALTEKVNSIVRAIIMLGINTVKNLAISTSVMGQMQKTGSLGALDMEGYWRHCLGVGATAKKIALTMGTDPKDVEEFFIAGLLHDIGKIVLNKAVTEDYFKVIVKSENEHKPLIECESEILGINHVEVAEMITDKWRLTDELEEAILFHHKPIECKEEHKKLVYAVYVSNLWCNQNTIGFSGNMGPREINKEVLNYLGIKEADIYKWENEIEHQIKKATVFLKINKSGDIK